MSDGWQLNLAVLIIARRTQVRATKKKIDEDVVILNGGTQNTHETYQLYLLAKTIKTKRNLEKTFFVILNINFCLINLNVI